MNHNTTDNQFAKIEALYQQIADYIVDNIHDEWTNAEIQIQIGDDVDELTSHYHKADDSQEHYFKAGYVVSEMFRELRANMVALGENEWRGARYSIDSEGEFQLEFNY